MVSMGGKKVQRFSVEAGGDSYSASAVTSSMVRCELCELKPRRQDLNEVRGTRNGVAAAADWNGLP
jgi:hypothetical protein